MGITFTPLNDTERDQLAAALRRNAGDGAALLLDRRDTTFRGAADELPTDLEVVTAIRSVPCHYSHGGNYTLPRSGQAMLRFQGVLVAESDGERQTGRGQNRWHELAVYRTAAGQHVVRIAYRTRYQGELDHDTAEVCATPDAVAAALTRYPVEQHVRGFPPGEVYQERQAKLLTDMRARYDAQVSGILAELPECAEEVA